jgi:colanic acid/amylovoran biosynthesis glycosyltransferase
VLAQLTLVVCPSVPIWNIGGELFFDRKFHDGILSYCDKWGGSVHLIMRIAYNSPPAFGLVLYDADIFPAELAVVKQGEQVSEVYFKKADIALISGDNFNNLHLSKITKKLGVKVIYDIEYVLETRFQIINMSNVSRWQKVKSLVWTVLTEVKRRRAFRLADGIQANGVPAYKAYNKGISNSLLYFDSRNSADANVTETELTIRLATLDKNRPIRLGFSGRLITMKGVEHLIEMARILKHNSLPFTLDIFGAGELALSLEKKVKAYQLEGLVNLRGNVDFSKILIPFIKENLDLFVCCHRQSDPSCTYLETYACGVPIVGYANQAHQGILEKFDVGWSVPMNDVNALAEKVIYLSKNRAEIKNKAINSRLFSSQHTFERTFSRRIQQCSDLVGK